VTGLHAQQPLGIAAHDFRSVHLAGEIGEAAGDIFAVDRADRHQLGRIGHDGGGVFDDRSQDLGEVLGWVGS
jgi:hypothetical protein